MGGLVDALIAWSIRQRLLVLAAAVAAVAVGLWSAAHAHLDVVPEFTPPLVGVQVEAPGMATTEVEQLVTTPVEQVLLGTPQLVNVRSVSIPGISALVLTFEDGVDLYRARQQVTERLTLLAGRLPEHVEPRLEPVTAPIGALLKFCITAPGLKPDEAPHALNAFAAWRLRSRLLAIPGVAQVTVMGGEAERIEVRPDPRALRERGVTLSQLAEALGKSQALLGVGFVEQGEARLDLRLDARLRPDSVLEQLRALPVTATADGLPIRVGELATVAKGSVPLFGAALYDGKPAAFVQVNKLPGADTLAVTREVERALTELGHELPEGLRIEPPVFRQANLVAASVWSVGRAMLIGSVLVVAVLIAFLRSKRLAAISLTAIPLSVLAALWVLVWSGATVNGMTLGGLAIAVGEVVDDAIVDVENVWRRLRQNALLAEPRPVFDVIRDASREVRGSVVYATIVVCLVLIPVLSLGGLAGKIFSPLGWAYILAIAASLLVALTITPALCALLLPSLARERSEPTALSRWLVKRYRRVLARTVRHPRWVIGAAGLAAVTSLAALPFIGGGFLPAFHEQSMIAHVNAVPGTSLDIALTLSNRVDALLRPSLVQHTTARAGRAELGEDVVPVNQVEMDLVLNTANRAWEDVIAEVNRTLAGVPGIAFSVESFLGERVQETLSGSLSPLVVKVIGPDLGQLRALAADAAARMEKVPGIGAVRVDPQVDVPQLEIHPDAVALARYGIRPAELADQLATARQGLPVARFNGSGGRGIDVVLAASPEAPDVQSPADYPVWPGRGLPVSLRAVAELSSVPGPALIQHDGGERRIAIGAAPEGPNASGIAAEVERQLSALKLPTGYRIEVSGEALARAEAAKRLALMGALVLLGIFVLLTMAFSSFRDAGVVLLNLPLGLVGGLAAALLSDDGLSVAALVGFVTLFGIIARNGIMLVAHQHQLVTERPELSGTARTLLAAEERLLPILMTAATAGLGLLPLALSSGSAGSEIEGPMALIVLGGLFTATALNLLVLPTLYHWLEERRLERGAGT